MGMESADSSLKLLLPSTVSAQRKPLVFPMTWILLLLVTDIGSFAISALLAMQIFVRLHLHPAKDFSVYTALESSIVVICFQLLIFERLGLYRRSFAASIRDEFYYATTALTIGAAPLLIFFSFVPLISTSRLLILMSLGFSTIGIGITRSIIYARRSAASKRVPRRIAVIGRPSRAEAAAETLRATGGTEVLRIDVEDLDETIASVDLSDSEFSRVRWFNDASGWNCDTLMFTESLPPAVLPLLLHAASRRKMKVTFAPPRFRVHAYTAHLEIFGDQALLVFGQLKACTMKARIVKRTFDVFFASIMLLVSSPVMLICLIAIKIESPGPLFYRQKRVGRNGKVFDILKLRSMRVDAETESGPVWAVRGDSRVTRVGRFLRRSSLDEIPQLINVLRGEMSTVGPRPERPAFVNSFRASIPRYDERHLVSPGLTGWSQVHMRRTLKPSEVSEKLSYDLFYLEQWSLFLDLSIVSKTAAEFLFHAAA